MIVGNVHHPCLLYVPEPAMEWKGQRLMAQNQQSRDSVATLSDFSKFTMFTRSFWSPNGHLLFAESFGQLWL